MARVTVEDCIKVVKNRFKLVVLASRRARNISSGAEIKVSRDNDKDAVVSLREIAEKEILKEDLLDEVISSYQSNSRYIAEEVEVSDDKTDKESGDDKSKAGMFQEDNIEVED